MGGGVWTWGVESGRVLRLPAAAVLEEGAGRGAGRDARAANTGPTVSSLFPRGRETANHGGTSAEERCDRAGAVRAALHAG